MDSRKPVLRSPREFELFNVRSLYTLLLSTKIRPKKNYKTNRKDLDGGALDIQNVLNQKWLPEFHMRTWKGKKYNYCGPNTRLE